MIKINKNIAMLIFAILLGGAVTGFALANNENGDENLNFNITRADSPIRINSDTELVNHANSAGWTGDGSASNPYVIENYHIDVGTAKNGIYLGNTTLHVIIKNCEIYNVTSSTGNGNGAEISIFMVENVTVEGVYIHESKMYGIYIYSSSNVSIVNSTVENNTFIPSNYGIYVDSTPWINISNNTLVSTLTHSSGISLQHSDYPAMVNNRITGFREGGVVLKFSAHATIWNSTIGECGIRVEGSSMEQYEHDIPVNNTINGKPVYYYRNMDFHHSAIELDAGEIIMHNVSNVALQNMNISHTSTSIILSYSHNVSLEDITMENTGFHSLYSYSTDNLSIENTTVINAGSTGLYLYMSNDVQIAHTTVQNSHSNGIYAYYSYRLFLFQTRVTGNYYGFYIYNNYYQTNQFVIIENSEFSENSHSIAKFSYALNVHINNTRFENNSDSCVVFNGFNHDSSVTNSTMIQNDGYGIYSSHSNNLRVENNTIVNTGDFDGIYLQYQRNAIIAGNYLDNTYGMVLNAVNDLLIHNNTIKNSKMYGMKIVGGPSELGNNTVWGNVMENSSNYGAYLNSTAGNLLFNNSFISNNKGNVQAYDDTGNKWNLTSGGNYWSDWTSPDNDNDGFVDSPYAIDGGMAEDKKPLANSPYIPELNQWIAAFVVLIAFTLIAIGKRSPRQN